MEMLMRATEIIKSIKETRLSGLRPPSEFFDYQRVSRPADLNQATSRISYNTRYFSGNYGVIVAILALYALLNNRLLLFSISLFVVGFIAINKYAPEATQFGEHTITQKHLYGTLFCISIPLFLLSGPIGTVFSLIGSSGVLILGHACLLEPGVESEYATIQENV